MNTNTETSRNNFLVAQKLNSAWDLDNQDLMDEILERPYRVRVLIYLAWASQNHPGGLKEFASSFLDRFADRVVPTCLQGDAGGILNEQLFEQLSEEVPFRFQDTLGLTYPSSTTLEHYRSSIRRIAKENFPDFLSRLVRQGEALFTNHETVRLAWYFPSWEESLEQFIEEKAQEELGKIAKTKVTTAVFKWAEIVQECREAAWLTGSCRYGKTESLRALAKAFPHKFRIVETPDNSSTLSLCRAIAEALGMDSNRREEELRHDIQWFLSATRLTLIFDEAHFLLPVNFHKNTRPRRLDLVRRTILDRGHGALFVSTPQSYSEMRKKFIRHTGYTIGQWEGRMLKAEPIELPEEISEEEMVDVCAKHLPGALPQVHKYIALKAASVRSASVFAQVAKVAKLASFYAKQKGRQIPKLEDVETAILDVSPTLPEPAQTQPRSEASTARQSVRGHRSKGNISEVLPTIPNRTTKTPALVTS